MLVDSVSSRYQFDPSLFGVQRKEKAQKDIEIPQTEAVNSTSTPTFVLHSTSPDASEKLVSAWASNDGNSISIFRPADFDPEHPIYRAKIWDASGNVTEREIDITQINPQSSDKVEMFAYSSHLADTGQCSNAQLRFMMACDTAAANANNEGGLALTQKIDWKAAVAELMERQREVGNMESYLACEDFLSYLS